MQVYKLKYRVHAIQRMFERDINEEDIDLIISDGTVIEEYPDDSPYPSRLVSGEVAGRPLHIVVAENVTDGEIIVITVYEPDPLKWDSNFRRRI